MTTPGYFRETAHDTTGRRHARWSRRVQPDGPSTGSMTLLLIDPDHPQQLTARFERRWARLVVRLLAPSLDRHLAQGRPPETNRLSATRAHMLVSPVMRRALVQNWENLLVQVHRPPVMRDPRAPLNRAGIVTCEPFVHEMLCALAAPLPVPARGVAMVSRLLRDGTGPLYDRRRSADLGVALEEAITQLDPTLPLTVTR